MSDRILAIKLRGLRCFDEIELPMNGLTVLIGKNGSGKSTVIEGLELLRKASRQDFIVHARNAHGGSESLLRQGSNLVELEALVELSPMVTGTPLTLMYRLALSNNRGIIEISEEDLIATSSAAEHTVVRRTAAHAQLLRGTKLEGLTPNADQTMLSAYWGFPDDYALTRVQRLLAGLEVFPPMSIAPRWAVIEGGAISPARQEYQPLRTTRLGRFGSNLANVLQHLRNSPEWNRYLDLLRQGLDTDIENVQIDANARGGQLTYSIKYSSLPEPVPESALSDGTVAYMALLTLMEFRGQRVLLALDEPELHLHPNLLLTLVDLMESAAERAPIIVATHSDRLLDGLKNPARQARVLDVEKGVSRLRTLDATQLARWLEKYRGLGHLRSEGHLYDVMADDAG